MLEPLCNAVGAGLHTGWGLLRQVAAAWLDDYVPSMGAALAYYTMFSLAPLLLIVVSVAGMAFGQDAARGEIQAQLQGLMGEQGAGAVQALLASVREPAESLTATVVGLVLLLVGATTVFGELQDAMDRIWHVPGHERASGWFSLVRARLLSFGMILAIGFLLIVSLLASATLAAMGRRWSPVFGDWQALVEAANAIVGFLVVALMFGLIYKVMPRQRVRVEDVWLGAVLAALLFTLGKSLIGAYIGRSGIASGFGAAGSLVVVLSWVYFSAQILLLGAAFSVAHARTFGPRRAPSAGCNSRRAADEPPRTHRASRQQVDPADQFADVSVRHPTERRGVPMCDGAADPPSISPDVASLIAPGLSIDRQGHQEFEPCLWKAPRGPR